MSSRNPKITEVAIVLLARLAKPGDDYVGFPAVAPPGLQALMQHGYAVRVGIDRAAITPTGRAFLAGVEWRDSRAGDQRHAS